MKMIMTNTELQEAIDSTREIQLMIPKKALNWECEEWKHLVALMDEQLRRATEQEVDIDA